MAEAARSTSATRAGRGSAGSRPGRRSPRRAAAARRSARSSGRRSRTLEQRSRTAGAAGRPTSPIRCCAHKPSVDPRGGGVNAVPDPNEQQHTSRISKNDSTARTARSSSESSRSFLLVWSDAGLSISGSSVRSRGGPLENPRSPPGVFSFASTPDRTSGHATARRYGTSYAPASHGTARATPR
jgi:hypothetical protein